MLGLHNTEGDSSVVPCAQDVHYGDIDPLDGHGFLPVQQLQDEGPAALHNYRESMVSEPENFQSQKHRFVPGNADWVLPILRSWFANADIKPTMPESLQRYSKRPKIEADSVKAGLTVEMWQHKQLQPIAPIGWTVVVHHEGGRYFVNPTKRVYTDADLYDPNLYRRVMRDLEIIEGFMMKNQIWLPETCQLVFDLVIHGDAIETKYYFVNHQNRSVFFLDTFVVDPWIDTPGRLGHEIEGQYWYHLNVYPDSWKLSLPIIRELKDMTIHLIGDKMTASNGSNAPYSIEDLQRILDWSVIIEKSVDNYDSVGAMSFVSRIMYIYSRSRFWDYAGDPHARIERGQSVYSTAPKKRHAKTKKLIFIALFGIPESYLKSIEKLWVDQMVFHLDWIELLNSRVGEWNNYILIAAIMLNVNIGFVATQFLLPSHNTRYEVGAFILASMSFLANCGSIFSGFYLVRQTPRNPTAQKLHAYLSYHESRWLGIDSLAILHSLPYAFLTWGFVLLLSAFFIFAFRLSGLTSLVSLVGFSFALLALGVWVHSDWADQSAASETDNDAAVAQNKASATHDETRSNTPTLNIWRISNILRARRASYDSQHTVV